MHLLISLLKGLLPKRPIIEKAILATAFVAPFLFSSCSIFKSKPDIRTPRYPEQIYKSQREKKPNLSTPKPSTDKTPYWYRERRINPENLPQKKELPKSSSETQLSRYKNFLKKPKVFADELDQASLRKVIANQLKIMELVDPLKIERLGDLMVTHGWLKKTLISFLNLINENLSLKEFSKRLHKEFIIHRVGKGKKKQVLFTGYYAPTMKASRVKTKKYRYPIYKLPESSSKLQLVGHSSRNYHVHESSAPNAQEWRNYTRRQIDGEGILDGRKLEIAWLENDIDRFFLHIQGSGQLLFTDGTSSGAHFAGVNNYKFGGLGKRMIADGVIELAQGSMQGIKKYFNEHPENIQKYFFQNKRYIFFKLSNKIDPRGSGGGELVGGRSIATDKKIYPAGGLAFLQLRKPILNINNEIVQWKKISQFVVDQDTGNAIRGAGRADFYFGIGDRAGAKAGRFHEWGNVFYIVKRVGQWKDNS